MAGVRRDQPGGIWGLYGLVEAHREAIDYDCLTLGLDLNDLGSERFDWRRLRAIIRYLPATSALARSMHGDKALWDASEHLLAATVDALNAGNWQRGGGKGRKPKPIPRPGTEDENKETKRLGTAKMTVEEAKAYFDRLNRPVHAAPVGRTCSEDECGKPHHAKGLCGTHYQQWRRSAS